MIFIIAPRAFLLLLLMAQHTSVTEKGTSLEQKILVATRAFSVEQKWVSFMMETGYPANSPKMREGLTRLDTRRAHLESLHEQQGLL